MSGPCRYYHFPNCNHTSIELLRNDQYFQLCGQPSREGRSDGNGMGIWHLLPRKHRTICDNRCKAPSLTDKCTRRVSSGDVVQVKCSKLRRSGLKSVQPSMQIVGMLSRSIDDTDFNLERRFPMTLDAIIAGKVGHRPDWGILPVPFLEEGATVSRAGSHGLTISLRDKPAPNSSSRHSILAIQENFQDFSCC